MSGSRHKFAGVAALFPSSDDDNNSDEDNDNDKSDQSNPMAVTVAASTTSVDDGSTWTSADAITRVVYVTHHALPHLVKPASKGMGMGVSTKTSSTSTLSSLSLSLSLSLSCECPNEVSLTVVERPTMGLAYHTWPGAYVLCQYLETNYHIGPSLWTTSSPSLHSLPLLSSLSSPQISSISSTPTSLISVVASSSSIGATPTQSAIETETKSRQGNGDVKSRASDVDYWRSLRILELGAGCGLVSLMLARYAHPFHCIHHVMSSSQHHIHHSTIRTF
jgi:hypothetical protein